MKSSIARRLVKPIAAGALIFYVFSGISSVLNYAFYPVIARFVTVAQYGEIQFLVSMFTQLAVGFVVLNILAIIIGAELKNTDEQKKATHSLTVISTFITGIIIVAGAIILIGQKNTLNISESSAVFALCLSLLVNVPFTIAIGKLQGNNRFVASGVISMLAAFLKLLFSVSFVALGYGVTGAIFGIFIGMAVSLGIVEIINLRTQKAVNPNRQPILRKHHLVQLIFIRDRAIVALIAVTLITLLSAADSITSRIVLSGTEAGHYAAVATIAKMILAATSPLMWLALPPAIQNNSKTVLRYISVALIVSIIASICFIATPSFFAHTIIGVDPKTYTDLISIATIGMTLCATAFIVLTAAICMGYLRSIIITMTLATLLYFTTILALESSVGPLVSSLYGQIIGSLGIIIGLMPKLLFSRRS